MSYGIYSRAMKKMFHTHNDKQKGQFDEAINYRTGQAVKNV